MSRRALRRQWCVHAQVVIRRHGEGSGARSITLSFNDSSQNGGIGVGGNVPEVAPCVGATPPLASFE
eukprot:scaffold75527_cov31-Tisochrysis_lutea.AAC.1